MRLTLLRAVGLVAIAAGGPRVHAQSADDLVKAGISAEARGDSQSALNDFLRANDLRPGKAPILEAISRQYSDLSDGMPTREEKIHDANQALKYAQEAVQADAQGAANVVALAVSYGKLALWGTPRERLKYAGKVKENIDRAIALDPKNAWAHHVLGEWNREVATVDGAERFLADLFLGGLPRASLADAISELRLAAELDPKEPAHWIELGVAYAKDHQPEAAREAFNHGLTLGGDTRYDQEEKRKARKALGETP